MSVKAGRGTGAEAQPAKINAMIKIANKLLIRTIVFLLFQFNLGLKPAKM
jgi:hypothetical protein